MNKTPIEWVKNPDGGQGHTWNPITGCLNGCEYCYARKLANGRLRKRYLANDNIANPIAIGRRDDIEEEAMEKLGNPFYPRFWPRKLWEITEARKGGRGIFVCDMSDLFGIGIPEEWTSKVLSAIRLGPEGNRYYLLTKQPQNLAKWSPFPDNCWVGVSITNTRQAIAAVAPMAQIEAKVKFISYEPLLERVPHQHIMAFIDQVIIGAQTKPTVMPRIEWVQEIVEAAGRAGVAVFLKDNLRPLLYQLPQSCVAWTGWGEQVRRTLRQEVP